MRNRFYLYTMLISGLQIFFLSACSDDHETIPNDTSTAYRKVSESDTTSLNKVLSEKNVLLSEIDICGNGDASCVIDPVFYSLHEFKDMSSGFAIRFHYPNESNKRKTYVYVQKDKGLECINKFEGPILANDTTQSDFPDLLIRLIEFKTNKRLFYNCWFKYNVDKTVYEFDYCDLIEEKPNTNSMNATLVFDYYIESAKVRKEMNDKLRLKLKNQGLY